MVNTVIPPNSSTRLAMSGTDTLVDTAGGVFSVSASAQTVRFTGPTNGASIDDAGFLINTNAAGRAIRAETPGVGTTFTASIINRATGVIQSPEDAIQIQAGTVTSGTLSIANAGGITTVDGQAIDLAGGTGTFVTNITNTGTIGSTINDAVRFGSTTNSLINSGTINGGIGAGYAVGADGVQFDLVGSGGTVTNQLGGTISGDRHGINATTGTFVTVTNDATSTLTGRNGSGVGLDGSGSVTNYGIITGAFSNSAGSDVNGTTVGVANGGGPDGLVDGDGDGIDIDGQATIDNYGTIQGTGAGGSGSDGRLNTSEAIAAGGGSITNRAGGIIQGLGLGILIDDSSTGPASFATTVINLGSITGTNSFAIRLIGTQADTVDNGGAISGGGGTAMLLGGGDDTLILRDSSVITGITNAEAGVADTLDYSNWTTGGVTVSLLVGTATGTGGIAGFENVTGSALADILAGDAGVNSLSGGAGNDTIAGGGGDDLMDGGNGIDTLTFATAAGPVVVDLGNATPQNTGHGTSLIRFFENLVGSAFGDTLAGDSGANVIDGGAGNDTASYASASQAVYVGLLAAGAQNTQGAGTDTLISIENLLGSAFNDTMSGDAGANVLTGGNGNDVLFGDAADDTLFGGDGNDTLHGGTGNDSMTGGDGGDTYFVDALADLAVELPPGRIDTVFVSTTGWTAGGQLDRIFLVGTAVGVTGSADAEMIVAHATLDSTLDGGDGNDTLVGQAGNDTLNGGPANDTMAGGLGNDVLNGGDDFDLLFGEAGQDTLSGGAGDDTLYGQDGSDLQSGGDGNDILAGGLGNDTLDGGDLFDLIYGEAGNDMMFGGTGLDTLYGQGGDDTQFGEAGDNTLAGGIGNDSLDGGDGTDLILGEAGNDVIAGGAGQDTLIGGAGADAFYFASASEGADFIFDFNRGEGDTVRLQSAGFGIVAGFQLTAGTNFFYGAGVVPTSATASFYLDTNTNALWFDADGTAAAGAGVVTFLAGSPLLTASDIVFV